MKHRSTPLLFCSCLIFLSLGACVMPRPVVRVEPTDMPTRWNYGQAIVEAERDSLVAGAAFAFSDRDYLVFDIEVTNWRNQRILIDPARIELEVPGLGVRIPAVDPEAHLLGMELEASRREASRKNAAIVAGVVAVAAVTAAVISEANDNGGDGNNFNNNDVVNIAPTIILGAGGGAPPPVPATVDPWFWSDQTLRKTTLDRGQQIRGKVLFPRNDELRIFELLVPVEELIFTFEFKQQLHRP